MQLWGFLLWSMCSAIRVEHHEAADKHMVGEPRKQRKEPRRRSLDLSRNKEPNRSIKPKRPVRHPVRHPVRRPSREVPPMRQRV